MTIARPERAVASVLALSGAALLARRPGVSNAEQQVFRVLNRCVGPAEKPVWALMQLGNGLVAGVAPLAMLGAGRPRRQALQVGLAAGGAWNLAKVVKKVVERQRPAALLDDVVLRDGNPVGLGFVSGHATVAMSVALAAAPVVSPTARRLLIATAVGVGLARVHVGAHLPLDIVGGIAVASLWGPLCARLAVAR